MLWTIWSQRVRVFLQGISPTRPLSLRDLAACAGVCGLWAGLAAAPGCRAPGLPDAARTSPATAHFTADWDDIDAAADLAAQRTELAVLHITDPTGRGCTKRIELLGVRGEPGVLTISRPEPCEETQSQPLTVEVRIGRFGDPEREASFIKVFRDRLEQLHGRDYAPIR